MTLYTYKREYINNHDGIEPESYWNIDNPRRIDEFGEQIRLAKEISLLIENEKFLLNCIGEDVFIDFVNELSEANKLILDDTVYKHKNNL